MPDLHENIKATIYLWRVKFDRKQTVLDALNHYWVLTSKEYSLMVDIITNKTIYKSLLTSWDQQHRWRHIPYDEFKFKDKASTSKSLLMVGL
jgi:hypothetical protein